MKKTIKILFCLIWVSATSIAQNENHYETAFDELKEMLEGKKQMNYAKALFEIENAWHEGTLNYVQFESEIKNVANICRTMIRKKGIEQYKTAGNWAIFMWMMKPVHENSNQPFTYNFEDFLGREDYSNTFVTKLIETRKGTCLSLPLFYKCVAQELGMEARLTLGPSHAWIRHKDEEGKWVNVELTSGQFPSDGLMMTELGIKTEAVKSGAYFKPLSESETIAFLLTKLAQIYQDKTGKFDDFTDRCADLSLQYCENNVAALMIKSNRVATEGLALLEKWSATETEKRTKHEQYLEYQKKLNEIGAATIPDEDYNEWVSSMKSRNQ